MHTVDEALELILKECAPGAGEEIDLLDVVGRVLDEDIYADRDYPPFNRSAMDGYALRSSDFTDKGLRAFKVTQEIFAGAQGRAVVSGECAKIMTGAPVPEGADAVIKVEDSYPDENADAETVKFNVTALKPWSNISAQGEDVEKDKLLINRGTYCTPVISGTLASLGRARPRVKALPRIAIISTGDELIPVDQPVESYQIHDSNSYNLRAFLSLYGIKPYSYELVPDTKPELEAAVARGLEADILLLSGGVSMGDRDFVPEILAEAGAQKIFHKVAIKPGKPIWFGRVPEKTLIFGLPGNPVSCQVCYKVFIEPCIRQILGLPPQEPLYLPLAIERRKRHPREEFFPCSFSRGDKTLLMPVTHRGSGDIRATFLSHGVARQQAHESTLEQGQTVAFYPWSNQLNI